MKFDEILSAHVGEFGRYQKVQLLLVCLPTMFTAMHSLSWTFTAASVPFRCLLKNESLNDPENFMINDSNYKSWLYGGKTSGKIKHECDALTNISIEDLQWSFKEKEIGTEPCSNGFKWDTSEITNSALKKWEMVCGRKWLKSLVQSTYYIGQFFGSLCFGLLADKIGRKFVFVVAILVQVLCGTAMAFIPYWPLFALFRFGLGFSHPGIFMMAVIISVELVGPGRRVLSSVVAGVFFAIGEIALGSLSYGIRDYQRLQICITVPALCFLAYWWFVPESPRWLISRNQMDKADIILRKIAKVNKRQLPDDWQKQLDIQEKNDENSGKYGLLDLVRTKNIRRRTLVCFICWPTVSMAYYGLAMNPNFFGGSIYVSFIVGGILEIVAVCIVMFIINYVGRKVICASGFFLASVCLFCTLAIPDGYENIRMIFVMVGKMLLTAVYCTIYVLTPEIFPTVIRSTAMGACSMIARVGATSASYISIGLADISPISVAVIFGTLCLLAAISVLFLPETTGHAQLETVEEAENFGKSQKMFELPFRFSNQAKRDDNVQSEKHVL